MLRKVLLISLLAALAFFGARALYRALASPEKKIRWRLEEMVAGFNARRARPVLDGIARDFIDRSSDLKRDDLQSILTWAYFNELDEKGEFLWRAAFDPQEMTIEVASDKHSANVGCHVKFFHRRGAVVELDWDAQVAGTLALGEEGWQWSVVESANHTARRGR